MFIEADPNRNADPVGFGKIRKFNTDTLILQTPFLSTSLEWESALISKDNGKVT